MLPCNELLDAYEVISLKKKSCMPYCMNVPWFILLSKINVENQ